MRLPSAVGVISNCAVLVAWPVWSQAQQSGQPASPPANAPVRSTIQTPIRQNVTLVNVVFSVFNQRNQMVAGLGQSDFQVFDDKQHQDIRFFSRQSDLPLRVGLLLDTSNSIRDRLHFEQDAAVDFLYKVIHRDVDQAFLMSVDSQPEVVQPYTANVEKLRDVVQRQRAGGGTALYDAIYNASEELLRAPAPASGVTADLRRVLVVISDGEDNLSRHSLREALDMAARADIFIYTISSSTNWLIADGETTSRTIDNRKYDKSPGDLVLQRFADDTGGRSFFPYHVEDLALSFSRIGDELRTQYSLAYVLPQNADGKFHDIRIAVNDKKMIVRARRGYYAIPPAVSVIPAPGG